MRVITGKHEASYHTKFDVGGRVAFDLDGYDCKLYIKNLGYEVFPGGWEHYNWDVGIMYIGTLFWFNHKTDITKRVDEFNLVDFIRRLESDFLDANYFSSFEEFVQYQEFDDEEAGRVAWGQCHCTAGKIRCLFLSQKIIKLFFSRGHA